MTNADYDVLVVGGGLAGLTAARVCTAAGLDVCVLEAKDHVGGRTLTGMADGLELDLGAEWVAPQHHTAVMRALDRYGLELDPAATVPSPWWAYGNVVESRGSGLTGEDEHSFRELCALVDADAARIDFHEPRWHETVRDLDIPMSQYLDRFATNEMVRSHFLLNCFALLGAAESNYSAMHALHEFAAFGSCLEAFTGETDRVRGGSMRIAASIAGDLAGKIHLGVMVKRIAAGDKSFPVEITTTAGQVSARAVIVAAPVNALRAITLDVPLSTAARDVIAVGHPGSVAKVWLRSPDLPQPYWSFGWPDVPEAYGRLIPGGQHIGAFQLVRNGDTHRAIDRVVEVMGRRHPGVTFEEETLYHDWINDPLIQGTWYTPAPGQAAGIYELAAQPGPCFFAGGDVSRRWAGWMDGALTSGEDAANRCATYLRLGTTPDTRG